jgi:esterase
MFVPCALEALKKPRAIFFRKSWKTDAIRRGAGGFSGRQLAAALSVTEIRSISVSTGKNHHNKALELDYLHIPPKCASGAMPKSPPILFLHGLLASWRTYRTVLQRPELAPSRDIYALDLRNHGTSPHSEDMSYDAMVEDVLAFMATHSIQRACIMGHSMGGKLAMAMALAYPLIVSEMVVIDAAPVNYNEHPRESGNAQEDTPQGVVQALAQLDPLAPHLRTRKAVEEALRDLGIRNHDVRQFALTNLVRTGNPEQELSWRVNTGALARSLPQIMGLPEWMQPSEASYTGLERPIATGDGTRNESRNVYHGPSLFIRGSRSNYVRDSHWPVIQRLFPNASLVTIQGAGHWLQSEKPADFIQTVNAFLDRSANALPASRVTEPRSVS